MSIKKSKQFESDLQPDLLDGEEWRDVPDWGGMYSISNLGRVRRNYVDVVNQFGYRARQNVRVFRKIPIHPKGYHYLTLSSPERKWCVGVHKLIALAFIPNPNNYDTINHKNGIKTDNRIENLEWCSQEQNIQHAWNTGLIQPRQGERHGLSLLNEKAVRVIRSTVTNFKDNKIKREMGKRFGVGICAINDVLRRRSWKHVD